MNNLPPPNVSAEIDQKLANSYGVEHPFTKTVINTIRHESKERLFRFLKADPYFLDRHFQLFDIPDKLTGCPTDRLSMFRMKTLLYLDPFCIALYLRKSVLMKYILELGGNVNHENYATGIFCRSTISQDFMQFPPLCVIIRREFLDGLMVLMQHFSFKLEDTRISTFYLNSEIERVVSYDDVLSYTITVLKVRNNYPLKRIVNILLRHEMQVKEICINSTENRELTGFFLLKLTRATLSDTKLRMIATLITALEQVVSNKHYLHRYVHVEIAKLKEDFCSDIATHYNFTGLVCLFILYQRCLVSGRVGFDRMILSLINNLLINFSWRPVFLDCLNHSHILNLMHVATSNLSIDTVDKQVFLRVIEQVQKLKDEEVSKLAWMSKMKEKYNAHRGTYSKAPVVTIPDDVDLPIDNYDLNSSESSCGERAESPKVKKSDTSPIKADNFDFSKPCGLPMHLLTKSIPYWKVPDGYVRKENDKDSDTESDVSKEKHEKNRFLNESNIHSILLCNKISSPLKISAGKFQSSPPVSKTTVSDGSRFERKFLDASPEKVTVIPSCSATYPMADDDIMGPVAQHLPLSMTEIRPKRENNTGVGLNGNGKTQANKHIHGTVANWLLRGKVGYTDNNYYDSVSNSSAASLRSSPSVNMLNIIRQTNSSARRVHIFEEPNDRRNHTREKFDRQMHPNYFDCNNSAVKFQACVLHSRERLQSFNRYASHGKRS